MTPAEGLLSLTGKTALVTGASSGLGHHFAKTLAAAGADVVLAARRVDRLATLATEIVATGRRAIAVACDVTDTNAVAAAFDAGEAGLGPISIVVNNAGVASNGFITATTDEDWRTVMDVNLDGVFRVAREAATRMQKRGDGGAIVNIASILGLGVLKAVAPYAATKAAVIQLTKSMALELARDGIRVNALAPGYIETELNADFLSSDAGRKLLSKVPMRRAGVASVDELVEQLEHFRPQHRFRARLSRAIGRVLGAYDHPPHRAELIQDAIAARRAAKNVEVLERLEQAERLMRS
jgi:NAD(P)-dependent dehydrogenase (short-subunit alcohol dehydrogenase family)